MPMNVVDPSDESSFIEQILPKTNELGIAPLAMKSAAFGKFFSEAVKVGGQEGATIIPEKITMKDAFEFVLSLPIACWVSGMEKPEQVIQNSKIAREFKGLSSARRIFSKVLSFNLLRFLR